MRRILSLYILLLALGAAVGCEGAINPTKRTNEGLNTLSFQMDGETLSAGGRAPDWVRAVFGIFNPRPAEDSTDTPYRAVYAGFDDAHESFWIYASLTLNAWDASLLSLQFPARFMKEGTTVSFQDMLAEMPYCSGYERDTSFPQGYAFTPIRRKADFVDGSLHIRSCNESEGILSGEFQFKVRLISEGIDNETFHPGSSKDNQHPDTYEVRPRETVELLITRGTFDVKYDVE